MIFRISTQKSELESQLQISKNYTRKLEGHISAGLKGQQIAEFNAQLKEQLTSTRRELQLITQTKYELEALGDEKDCQLKVLRRALDIKAEELGLRGDMRSTLLFDLGQAKSELDQATQILRVSESKVAGLNEALAEALTSVEELKLIRHANNEELNELEAELIGLRQEKETETQRSIQLDEENKSLLDYIDEISQKCITLELALKRCDQEMLHLKAASRSETETTSELEAQLQEVSRRREEAEVRVEQLEDLLEQAELRGSQVAHLRGVEVTAEIERYRVNAETERAEVEAVAKELSEELVRVKEKLCQVQLEHDAQILEVNRQIHELQVTASSTEASLKLKLERAYSDIEELSGERESMREAMNEAISQCAAAMINQHTNGRERPTTDREKQRRFDDSPSVKKDRAIQGSQSLENERLRQLIASERRKSELLLGL